MSTLTSRIPVREQVRRKRSMLFGIATAILTLTVALPLYSEQPTTAVKRSAVIRSEYSPQQARGPYAPQLLPELLSVAPPSQVVNLSTAGHTQLRLTSAPLAFEPNRGQESGDVKFAVRGERDRLFLTSDGFAIRLGNQPQSEMKLSLVGAESSELEPVNKLPGVAHYYLSPDPKTWVTDVPMYERVQAKSVYPGIDLLYYGNEGQLEYDFVLQPGANPERIGLRLLGADFASLDSKGNLEVVAAGRKLRLLKPNVYQLESTNSRRSVAGGYRIHEVLEGGRKTTEVNFQIANYDRSRALVIDPVLTYSEQAPGTQTRGIQVDSSGDVYIAGESVTNGSLQVTKLASDATTVLYTATISSTFPALSGFTVDSSGRAYLTGYAYPGYPTTPSAYQQNVGSGIHVIFTALDATGHVSYSTYIAGSSSDEPEELTADATGKAYIMGETCSADFPQTLGVTLTTSCWQPFVLKMDPSQSGAASLVYSNILAESDAYALAGGLDSSNNLYVLVDTFSSVLQATPGAFNYSGEGSPNGVYVEKLNSSGVTSYVAYIGPGTPYAIAVEPGGDAYVTGRPGDGDFPTTTGVWNPDYPGGFLSKISADGTTLLYSTFLSGPTGTINNTTPTNLALNPTCLSSCGVYFSGYTTTSDMPVQSPIQAADLDPGATVAFLGQLNATGSQANFLTYFGGSNGGIETNCANDTTCNPYLAADSQGNIYTALIETSSDFPITGTAGPNYYNYIAKISPSNASFLLAVPGTVTFGQQPVGVGTSPVPPPNNYVNTNQIVLLRNMGSVAASISSINFDDPEFSETDNCAGSVGAGGTCKIQVQFDPSQSGARNGTMTISSNALDSPTAVQISGTGLSTSVVQLSTGELDFGSVAINGSSTLPVTVTNAGNTAMPFYGISITAPFSDTNNCPSLILPGASCTANISFNPVSAGYFSTTSAVSVTAAYSTSPYITLTGTGTGVGAPAFTASSPAINFPPTSVGATSLPTTDTQIALENTGTAPITINSFTITGNTGDFSIYTNSCGTPPAQVAPQSSCNVYLQFTPTTAGARAATLSIASSFSTTPLTVSLTGTGLAATPALVFSETKFTFPDTPIGSISSTDQPIQVNNVGNTPVTFYRVYDDHGDFHITSDGCGGVVLAASSYCNVYVEFAPTQLGSRTGTLTFVDSVTGSPQTVQLLGNGLTDTEVAVLNPTTQVFPDTVVGVTASDLTVTFQNSGDVALTITNVQSDNAAEFPIDSNGCLTGGSGPLSVAAGSSCTVYMKFTPGQAGARSAHLTFTDSAPGSPHVALLTGMGLNPTGALEINPTSIPFGTEAIGVPTSTTPVLVTNRGDSTVNITSVSSSSADFVISSDGCVESLPAGGTCYFYVAFDPSAAVTRNGTITVASSNAPSQGVSVTGTGVTATKALVVISPATLDWGTVATNSSNQWQVFVRNVGTETVTFGSITAGAAPFTLSSGCGGTLAVSSSCPLYITFSPTTTGTFTNTLSISSDASGSPQTVSLTGKGAATLNEAQYVPNGLQFDQVTDGSSSPLNSALLYLYNETGATVSYGTPTVSANFTLSPSSSCLAGQSVGAGSYCYYYVQFSPTSGTTGLVNGTLKVSVGGTTYTANLTGYAVAPSAQVLLSVSGISFPDQVEGTTSSPQIVYVSNVGNEPVTFGASTLTDSTDFKIYSDGCNGAIVPVNSYCYVYVEFTPGSAGSLTSTLTINDNASGGPHAVSLSGNGLAPTTNVELQPGGVSFVDTTVGQQSAAQQVVYLINTGNTSITMGANGTQICTTTGNPCTPSADFLLSSNACPAGTVVGAGSYCYAYVYFTPQAAGARSAVLRFNDNGTGNPHFATLSGNGVAAVNAVVPDRTTWNFPDTPIGANSASEYIYITNNGNVPVTISGESSNSAEFPLSSNYCANFATNPLPVGAQCYVYVTFSPVGPTPPGLRSATLTITTSANTLTIPLQGNATADVNTLNVQATEVDFGQVPKGVTASQYLYLTNTGNLPITLGTPVISDPEITLTNNECGTTIAIATYCYIYVNITPSGTGPVSGTIQYNDSATGAPHIITVKATGIADQVALSQTNIDFGSWAIGTQSLPVTVYYVNDTSATVTISTIVSSAPPEFVLNPNNCYAGRAVAAASSCSFTVYFNPTGANTQSGNITITDSTGTETVTLNGTGLNPFPIATPFPTRLTFPSENISTTSAAQTVTITNTGTAVLAFSTVGISQSGSDFQISSDGCTGADLSPGQNCAIYITFGPTTTGSKSGTLQITDTASAPNGGTINIPLNGTATGPEPTANASPGSLSFSPTNTGSTSTSQTVTVTNTGTANLTFTSITVSANFTKTADTCSAAVVGFTAPSNTCSVSVAFAPTIGGVIDGSLTFSDNALNTPQVVNLSGTGQTVPIYQLSTTTLNFPNTNVGVTSAASQVTLTNTGTATLNITSIAISQASTDYAITSESNCTTVAPQTACTIFITFTPTAAGLRTGNLNFSDNASNGASQSVSLTGTGVSAPAVTLTPTSLSFPSTNVGTTSAALGVTLQNTGTSSLAIASIASNDFPEFNPSNNCGPSLNAGSSCTINVTFTPSTYGARSGSIILTDNAGTGTQIIPVSGTGLGATLTITPVAGLTFAGQNLGTTSAAQNVTLTNSGNISATSVVIGTTDPAEFAISSTTCGTTLASSANCTISITFKPNTVGARNASVNATGAANLSGSAPLTGTGLGPIATLNPNSLTFTTQTLNTTSAAQSFTITNTGNQTLTFTGSGIATAAPFAISANNCGGSVAVAAFCTVSVTFTPTVGGLVGGQVTITDNAGTGTQSVSLTGTGASPAVTAISPNNGPTTGGTTVTITGTNLTGATAVTFGGAAAASFTVNSATSITAVSPAEAAGTVDVTVTTAGGTSAKTAADQFTFITIGGVPNIVSQVAAENFVSPGVLAVTVTFTNNGTGNASNVVLQTRLLRTLGGSGTVTFDASSPAMPMSLGNLAVGGSTTATFYLDVPATVTRFAMSETGADLDSSGVSHGISLGQLVVP